MILYPSIHIKDGIVGRLTRDSDDLENAEVLHKDPAERAALFESEGFPWLHVVDLNGAFEGHPVNVEPVERILRTVKIPVQLSGGMRSMGTIEKWLEKGVARIVLTSAAVNNPELTRTACQAFPGRIAVKVDSRAGYVATTGWTKTSPMKAFDLALQAEQAGAAAVILAEINRDGALADVNVEAVTDLAFQLTIPVIASGGINSLEELAGLKAHMPTGLAGLILGGALHSGKISAAEALQLAETL